MNTNLIDKLVRQSEELSEKRKKSLEEIKREISDDLKKYLSTDDFETDFLESITETNISNRKAHIKAMYVQAAPYSFDEFTGFTVNVESTVCYHWHPSSLTGAFGYKGTKLSDTRQAIVDMMTKILREVLTEKGFTVFPASVINDNSTVNYGTIFEVRW